MFSQIFKFQHAEHDGTIKIAIEIFLRNFYLYKNRACLFNNSNVYIYWQIFGFEFEIFLTYYIKSNLLIPNPQKIFRLKHFFYFFRIFEMIFSENALPKSPNLTCHQSWIFQMKYVNRTPKNRIWRYFCNQRISSIYFEFFF